MSIQCWKLCTSKMVLHRQADMVHEYGARSMVHALTASRAKDAGLDSLGCISSDVYIFLTGSLDPVMLSSGARCSTLECCIVGPPCMHMCAYMEALTASKSVVVRIEQQFCSPPWQELRCKMGRPVSTSCRNCT